MAGAIGASIAVTFWDDHAKVARSEMVSSMHIQDSQQALVGSGMSPEMALGAISGMVDREALTLSVNHVFLIFALIFLFASLLIWLCPRPKRAVGLDQMHSARSCVTPASPPT